MEVELNWQYLIQRMLSFLLKWQIQKKENSHLQQKNKESIKCAWKSKILKDGLGIKNNHFISLELNKGIIKSILKLQKRVR